MSKPDEVLSSARNNLDSAYFFIGKMDEAAREGNITSYGHYLKAAVSMARGVWNTINDSEEKEDWWKKYNEQLKNDEDYVFMVDLRHQILKKGAHKIDDKNVKFYASAETIGERLKGRHVIRIERKGGRYEAWLENEETKQRVPNSKVHFRAFYLFEGKDEPAQYMVLDYVRKQEDLVAAYLQNQRSRKYSEKN